MTKAKKRKHNIWKDPSRYGTYDGPYWNDAKYADAFKDAWDRSSAKKTIADESPWAILGIPVGSAFSEIKSAFRKLMLKNHPDLGGDVEVCKKIIAAYTLLEATQK